MKLFDMDSPLMNGLNKIADLMWLNLLTIICCLPIFTVGAAMTAMHYCALKLVRNEEGNLTAQYFKAFKNNFKQATAIWFILLAIVGILVGDFIIMGSGNYAIGDLVKICIGAICVFVLLMAEFVFALQARFSNTVFHTMKNAFAVGMMQFPRAILMTLLYAAPVVCILISYNLVPIVLLYGISLPVYLSAKLYNKIFTKLEARVLEQNPQETTVDEASDERIVHDELDGTLNKRG